MSALEADGEEAVVRNHVTAGEAQRLQEGTALCQARHCGIVHERATLEIEDLESAAVSEEITEHWGKEQRDQNSKILCCCCFRAFVFVLTF